MFRSAPSMRTAHLPRTKLFQPQRNLTRLEETELSYKRAQAIARVYALTAYDVLACTDKFWEMHMDSISILDGAAFTLLTIQYNLSAGTLAPFASARAELRPLMKRILDFEVSAQFLLTEVAHGLDAMNLETTATLLPDGGFDLHSPNEGSAKHMPPTGPIGGMPRVGIVIARLIVDSEDRGLRPFITALGDGNEMCKGITARWDTTAVIICRQEIAHAFRSILPKRAGSKPVDHALTYFNHVRLPRAAMLGGLEKPQDARANFMACVSRVAVGTLAMSLCAVPVLAVVTHVAAGYSLRRTVGGPAGTRVPIWSFRTQQLPILHALAQVFVMRSYARESVRLFLDRDLDVRVRMGVATAIKAALSTQSQASFLALSERCGAQGLYEHNQIISAQLQLRGVTIAEGDVLALSIRLATELLLGRYEMPAPRYPDCLLAQHETSIFGDCRAHMAALGSHRGETVNRLVLPLCQPMVEAIGYRMGYEAARAADVPAHLLALYEAGVLRRDAAWYAEHAGLSSWTQHEMEERAASAALPHFVTDLASLNAAPYAIAPILTQGAWNGFVGELEFFNGNAEVELIPSVQHHRKSEEPRGIARL